MTIGKLCLIAGGTLACWLAGSSTGQAHTLSTDVLGLPAGLAHPFFGVDHLLAMLAVGVWASHLGGRAAWMIPISSLLAILIGAILGWQGLAMPMMEPAILVSMVVIGGLIAWRVQFGLLPAIVIIAITSVWHGSAHVADIGVTAKDAAFTAGFLASTAALHLTGIAIGNTTRMRAPVTRLVGVAILGTGALLALG